MIAFIGALKLTTVADVAVIYAALPFLAAPLAWAWLGERPSRRTMVGGLVALGGVAVMMGGARLGGSLAGDLLALLQTCSMAYAVVAVRRFRSVPLVLAICLGNFLSCLLAAAAGASLTVGAGDLAVLAVFGAVQVALGSILFALGSRLAPAAETALICTVEVPLTPFWVWLAFGELPPATTFVGGALVLGASLAQMVRRRRSD
jgi:drug/metabolite transporter (DMT)-like permease